jgi:uncharacterized protein (DUF1499 family)
MFRHNLIRNNKSLSVAALMSLFCCVVVEPAFSGETREGGLEPCPASPNCISTLSNDPDKYMNPLPCADSSVQSRQILLSIIKTMPRSKIVMEEGNYIHAEFRSLIFRFVDDVEFLLDEKEKVIHFRSASRTGYSDLGVNRKRMQKISEQYLQEVRQNKR